MSDWRHRQSLLKFKPVKLLPVIRNNRYSPYISKENHLILFFFNIKAWWNYTGTIWDCANSKLFNFSKQSIDIPIIKGFFNLFNRTVFELNPQNFKDSWLNVNFPVHNQVLKQNLLLDKELYFFLSKNSINRLVLFLKIVQADRIYLILHCYAGSLIPLILFPKSMVFLKSLPSRFNFDRTNSVVFIHENP